MFKRAVSMILSILMAAESVPVTSFAEETVPVRLEAEFSSGTVTAPNGTISLNVRAELDGTDIPEETQGKIMGLKQNSYLLDLALFPC